MSTKKKLLQAAAGAAGGAGLDVSEVFSTYLYEGTGSAQTINNGIDLDGEGGLVWIKNRENQFQDHSLFDTTRSPSYVLYSNTTHASSLSASRFSSFNTNGFTVGTDTSTNESGKDIVSWTFRKAPKFFDVVTYTGDGTSDRQIAHNLKTTVGSVIIKETSGSKNWGVWHRSYPNVGDHTYLNTTGAAVTNTVVFGSTLPTEANFNVGAFLNSNSATYVAYIFAHNDGDGGFGPDGDQDVIKCGSYTGTGSSGNSITLGFEPQWLLIKNASNSSAWIILDNMRGLPVGGNVEELFPHLSNAENTSGNTRIDLTPTGFTHTSSATNYNTSGDTYIYMAIRRGPLAEPESATDVFGLDFTTFGSDGPVFGFANDMFLGKALGSNTKWYLSNRLTGNGYLSTDNTTAELSTSSVGGWDRMDGNGASSTENILDIAYGWKRAPKFFDIVAYTGNGSSTNINHNLGVVPEMMWFKDRGIGHWFVYHKALNGGVDPEDYYLRLNDTLAQQDSPAALNDTAPTASVFTTGSATYTNGQNYLAWLFATLAGISKVGSYTGNGSSQTIDCGFSTSARWIMIKRYDATGDWHVWDTEKGSNGGIVAGTEAFLELNTTNGISSYQDTIDPDSSGFTVHETTNSSVNASGASYIFYALA